MNRQLKEQTKFKVLDVLTGDVTSRSIYLTHDGRPVTIKDNQLVDAQGVDLLFYTGFADCNDEELYDLDICKYWMDGVWKYGVIQNKGGGFGIHVTKMGEKMTSFDNYYFGFQYFIPTPRVGVKMTDQFQKIGNAWTDPELLFEIGAQDTILLIAERRAGRKLDPEEVALYIRPTKIVADQLRKEE